jgi:hypothetical protein
MTARSSGWLLEGQRALRSRFDDFRQAVRRHDYTAAGVAIHDFLHHLERWTEAEEQALIPAVVRANIAGRDPRRELRLEYVQIRELTRFIQGRIAERGDATGFIENLDRRLHAHEMQNITVYYPSAAATLTEEEWKILETARPLP